jgi:hypothetical protein
MAPHPRHEPPFSNFPRLPFPANWAQNGRIRKTGFFGVQPVVYGKRELRSRRKEHKAPFTPFWKSVLRKLLKMSPRPLLEAI